MATPTSSQAAARQNGTASTGKKRKVASAAGAARYHKPIGSEIGAPRDASHAAIQQDQGARQNYGNLINGDAATQRKALDGMSDQDLNKLADIAFSFKSADPKVVALRIAARNAQARRGRTQTNLVQTAAKVTQGSRRPAAAKRTAAKKPAAKPAPAPARNMRGSVKAMSAVGPASQALIELAAQTGQHTSKLGNFPIPDVSHLRKAISAIGRAKPEHRPIIARHIMARAKALKATHLVSDHITHYARGHRQPGTVGMSRTAGADNEIELAGRWKHGYIPLDAEALASKMKGRTGGKKWWSDGHGNGGVSGSLRPHGSPKSGSPGDTPFEGGKKRQGPLPDVSKMSESQLHTRYSKAPVSERRHYLTEIRRRNAKATERMHAKAPSADAINKQLDRRDTIGKDRARVLGDPLTNVVKSGSADSKPRGAKMDQPHPLTRSRKPISQMSPAERRAEANRADTMSQRQPDRSAEWDSLAKQLRAGSASSKKVAPNAAFSRATMIKRAKENGLSQAEAEKWADNPNRGALLGKTELGPSNTPKPGQKQDTTGKSKLTFRELDPVTRKPVVKTPATSDNSSDVRHADEAKIAAQIASGKKKSTQGLLSPSESRRIRALQDAGKHDEAGAEARKALQASKARIAKLVEAKKKAGSGPGKA